MIPDHVMLWRKHDLRCWIERIKHERGLGVTVERGCLGYMGYNNPDPRYTYYVDVCLHFVFAGVRLGFRYKRN